MKVYRAPIPTVEQIKNGELHGYDPFDLCGNMPYWEFRDDDTLAAAGVIHDEMTLRGGDDAARERCCWHFERDALILANASDGWLNRKFQIIKAHVCSQIVWATAGKYWRAEDLNTHITRWQSDRQMWDAMEWINQQAVKIGKPVPYKIPYLPL